MDLTKKILEQLIKQELSLIERKIIDPSPEMQQKLRNILQTAPGAAAPSGDNVNFDSGDRMMLRSALCTSGFSILRRFPT